jgi:uncharacterized caspase-like protein
MVNVAGLQFWGGGPPPPTTPGGTHRAFVVGVNAYVSLQPLKKAVQDATGMAAMLHDKGYDVVSLVDPSRSAFVTAFETFCGSLAGAHKVVIHFSGHGFAPAAESFLAAADSTAGLW